MLVDCVLDSPYYRLERLSLEGNKITDPFCKILCNVIEYSSSLRFLDLSRNDISPAGAKHISSILVSNSSLLVLFIHWNPLLSQGGQYIARAVSKNSTLQMLDMSFCSLGSSIDKSVVLTARKQTIDQSN